MMREGHNPLIQLDELAGIDSGLQDASVQFRVLCREIGHEVCTISTAAISPNGWEEHTGPGTPPKEWTGAAYSTLSEACAVAGTMCRPDDDPHTIFEMLHFVGVDGCPSHYYYREVGAYFDLHAPDLYTGPQFRSDASPGGDGNRIVTVERQSKITGNRLILLPGASRYHVFVDGRGASDYEHSSLEHWLGCSRTLVEANQAIDNAVKELGTRGTIRTKKNEDGTKSVAFEPKGEYENGTRRAWCIKFTEKPRLLVGKDPSAEFWGADFCDGGFAKDTEWQLQGAKIPVNNGGGREGLYLSTVDPFIEDRRLEYAEYDMVMLPAKVSTGRLHRWEKWRGRFDWSFSHVKEWRIDHDDARWGTAGPSSDVLKQISEFNSYVLANHSRGDVAYISAVNGRDPYQVAPTLALTNYEEQTLSDPMMHDPWAQ